MEQMIRDLVFGKTLDLGNGWTVKKDRYTGFDFRKDGKYVESVVMTDSAVSFAEKNCFTEKSEAEMLKEISDKFFADTKATRKDGSLVIIGIESLSGGDAIRDAGGTRLVTENVTYDFIKSWAEKNGADFETVCKAINF